MGAVAGAVVGAAVANPQRTLEGAAIGAVVGGVAGNAADNAIKVRAGFAALHDGVAVGRNDAVAGFAFLEGFFAFFSVACRVAFGECRSGQCQKRGGGCQKNFHVYLTCRSALGVSDHRYSLAKSGDNRKL